VIKKLGIGRSNRQKVYEKKMIDSRLYEIYTIINTQIIRKYAKSLGRN
jgi:hypothetical protein